MIQFNTKLNLNCWLPWNFVLVESALTLFAQFYTRECISRSCETKCESILFNNNSFFLLSVNFRIFLSSDIECKSILVLHDRRSIVLAKIGMVVGPIILGLIVLNKFLGFYQRSQSMFGLNNMRGGLFAFLLSENPIICVHCALMPMHQVFIIYTWMPCFARSQRSVKV